MTRGVDYAWGRPAPASIKAAGYDVALRYLSHDVGKAITRPEADGLLAAGVDVVLVFEDAADRALGGTAAGQADGAYVKGELEALGAPPGMGAYLAVDFPATVAQLPALRDYFTAAAAVLSPAGYRVGAYGDYTVTGFLLAHGVQLCWQTAAWSGGNVLPAAVVSQRVAQVTIDGVTCDVDDILRADYGGWAGADMGLSDADRTWLDERFGILENGAAVSAGHVGLRDVHAQLAALEATVTHLATGGSTDPATIIDAARAGAVAALRELGTAAGQVA